MKNVIKILLLSLLCMAIKCQDKENENCHTAIIFSNNSEKNLYVRSFNGMKSFPSDDDIGNYRSTVQSKYKVSSGEQNNRKATDYGTCLERIFKNDEFSDIRKFYVFDAVVIENTPWEVVARDYLVLKRYDLTLEDLQRLDWKITYPPTEAMKDVKQYPPYE